MPYLTSPVSRFLLRISLVLFLFSTGPALIQLYAEESRSKVSMPIRVEIYESQSEEARPEFSLKGGKGSLNDDFVTPYATNDSVELQFARDQTSFTVPQPLVLVAYLSNTTKRE